jgi:hypothetical protein
LKLDAALAVLLGLGITLALLGFAFLRFKTSLRRPSNREVLAGTVVRLTDDEVRQDFSEGSFLAIKFFAITKVRQAGEYYFIVADKRNTIAVLKTAFASAEESQEFYRRLQESVRKA